MLIVGIGSAAPTFTKSGRGDGWGARQERIKFFFFCSCIIRFSLYKHAISWFMIVRGFGLEYFEARFIPAPEEFNR